MTTSTTPVTVSATPPFTRKDEVVLTIDDSRGVWAMIMFIATEAFLFSMLFFAYFYAAQGGWRYQLDEAPALLLPTIMMAELIGSGFTIFWGGRALKSGNTTQARVALVATIVLGLLFLALQSLSYADSWGRLTPQSNFYGSIFYTIGLIHNAHIIVGLLMLFYALFIRRLEPARGIPHRPFRCVQLYWYFAIVVFAWVYGLLYVLPNTR
jgi:heme/copper-type cytochrome/quinol oxidase subunit 3